MNDTVAWDLSGCFDSSECIDIDPFTIAECEVVSDPLNAVKKVQFPINETACNRPFTTYCKLFVLELMIGLEPTTYALPRRCATDCATSASTNNIIQ